MRRDAERAKPEPSIDRGPLRRNLDGRWEIFVSRGWPTHEVTSGDVVFVEVERTWKLTRIEFDQATRQYVSVDGYRLADGVLAALPTG